MEELDTEQIIVLELETVIEQCSCFLSSTEPQKRMFCSGAACGFEQGNVSCVVGCGSLTNKWWSDMIKNLSSGYKIQIIYLFLLGSNA